MVTTSEGADIALAAALAQKPTVLIFYRGSWCPDCNRHLAALAGIEPQLLELGSQIITLSPDKPKGLLAMAEKNHLNYRWCVSISLQSPERGNRLSKGESWSGKIDTCAIL